MPDGIRTPQRRALESLLEEDPRNAISVDENTISVDMGMFYLDGTQIFLLGVSQGIGTCSDFHGINIAVFSKEVRVRPVSLQGPVHELCAGLALLRGPTDEEKAAQKYPDQACLVVEKLKILEELQDCEHVSGTEFTGCRHLTETGAKTLYANTT